jgi:F-type H+-transporting ATPase subunit a
MSHTVSKVFLLFAGLIFFISGAFGLTRSQEHVSTSTDSLTSHQTSENKEVFEPGNFIFNHIKDAHEWHVITINQRHISIPLPVILYSKNKGLQVFMSSKLDHGHAVYRGFHLETSGKNKGKIVEEGGSLPFDLSITKNIAAMFLSIALIFWIFLSIGKAYRNDPIKAPSGLQSFVEPVVIFIRDEVAKPSIGEKLYERYMPFLLTIFFFIWINNMLGLIPIPPGGANLTGNIAVTMVLALFTFIITTFSGNRNYWQHIFNTPGVPLWLKLPVPLIPLVEIIGVITKPFVLMVRLFANITAGHIITLGFITLIYIFGEMSSGLAYGVSIISIAFNIFMFFLELLVAFIQAFVFTFLSAIYFGLATEEHHEGH